MVQVRVGDNHSVWRELHSFRWAKVSWEQIWPIGTVERRDQPGMPKVVKAATATGLQELTEESTERAEVQSEIQ